MLRLIFATVMILHGLLHLIGFAKEWNIGPHQVSNRLMAVGGSGSRFAGVMWLVASVLFVTAAICFLLRRDWYWIPGGASVDHLSSIDLHLLERCQIWHRPEYDDRGYSMCVSCRHAV